MLWRWHLALTVGGSVAVALISAAATLGVTVLGFIVWFFFKRPDEKIAALIQYADFWQESCAKLETRIGVIETRQDNEHKECQQALDGLRWENTTLQRQVADLKRGVADGRDQHHQEIAELRQHGSQVAQESAAEFAKIKQRIAVNHQEIVETLAIVPVDGSVDDEFPESD